ncbi:autotransporter-associated N-terminal domain-containing protein, partial [Fusobacterium necrophorum]|uniref:autotransporter-associated N-terminal domain-containing protein n=1 Tax=Fusobacterium necrophorum TaxID=859 RepID=UPI0021BE557B
MGLVLLYVMLGMNAFAQGVNVTAVTKQEIGLSTDRLSEMLRRIKEENSKKLKGTQLELVQLMEQGDQVVKSPWASWQFGLNYMYNNWSGSYKGGGDKKEKYPYEGKFERSKDLFLRNISPDSNVYEKYTALSTENFVHPATTSVIAKQRANYGLEDVYILQEPILTIELGASVKPKEVVKNPVTVTPPSITISPVTPLSVPAEPAPPTLPRIDIPEFNPVAPDPITVSLPTPPTFNIKLGSYCNGMSGCGIGIQGRAYNAYYQGFAKTYNTTTTVTGLINGSPSLRHSWSNTGSVLLKSYFDFVTGGTVTLGQNVTIDSINPLTASEKTSEDNASRPYNTHNFLLGGSRVATMDNVFNGSKMINNAEVNLAGPLVIGFEMQTDTLGSGSREISNTGKITDKIEEEYRGTEGLGGLTVGKIGGQTVASNSVTLPLSTLVGSLTNTDILVSRTPDIVDSNGIVTTKGGYTGYKIGLILTYEDNDNRVNSYYTLSNAGTINFTGKSSIGIQVFAPGSVSMPVTVKNTGTITLGGIESYGLKLSSRIKEANSLFTNASAGTINISGSNGANNSLSSGIAILEDNKMTGANSIRSYKGKVKNEGIINISGGQGNTGMVMILKSDDNITNEATGKINVTGSKNIGMRVDYGSVTTDDTTAIKTPEAINKGKISITDGDGNIGMVAHKDVLSGDHAIAINNGTGNNGIIFNGKATNAIGMFSQAGGEVINETSANIKGNSTTLVNTIGMVINDVTSGGKNKGIIDIKGKKVTGVYNNKGTFEMTDGSIKTFGEKSISLYSKENIKTKITKGTITAEGKALGLFADKATVELGDSNAADIVTLNAKDEGTLLFYNYTSGTNNAEGIFKLNNNIKGNLTNGATAFYFKDTTPGTSTGQTSDKLNAMFNGSTTGVNDNKIILTLDAASTLFVLDNTNPNTNYINLSSVDMSHINDFLGKHVAINTLASSSNFKAYKATKASLAINANVDLDNHTGAAIDKYYRVDFLNSNVRVDAGKTVKGTDATRILQAIAQANFATSTNSSDVKVENNGTIDFSKRNASAIVVDFAEAKNNGIIKMDAANAANENSIAMFGASSSKLENTANGIIKLGTNGVGIWGANKIDSSVSTWSKNIDITNAGVIEGISGKSGQYGIYAVNDTTTYPGAVSNITHSGKIDFSQNTGSTGVFMKNGTLNSSGDISIKEGSVGINATDSMVNITSGAHTIGKESVGFKLTRNSSNFNGTGGNISIAGTGSVAYLLEGGAFTSGTNFTDNLSLTSTNAYTYINAKDTTLNYENTKIINNDETIFINANNSPTSLRANTNISSTKEKVVGIYATNGLFVENNGTLKLTGKSSTALYGTSTPLTNETTGNIEIGENGSGLYAVSTSAKNKGTIKVGANSMAMRTDGGTLENILNAKISSSGAKALGMSQNAGGNIENDGEITLIGDQSIGMHSENATGVNHKIRNGGTVTVGDSVSAANPSIGIYSANGTNSTIYNTGKVKAGDRSIAIYGGNIDLDGTLPSETSAGAGGIAVYSKEGSVTIDDNAKLSVGVSLGKNKEGVAVYLAGGGQTLNSKTSALTIGDGSFGYVMTGQSNNVTTGYSGNTGTVTLGNDSIFLYSADKSTTGTITNYNHLKSTGNENYGLYVSGKAENRGNIDFSSGVGNVGIYSYVKGATTTPGLVKNYGDIKVSASDLTDPDNKKYGIGMAAGFTEEVPKNSGNKVVRGLGNIENHGKISVTTPDSIGMYAGGAGSKALNYGDIFLSGPKKNIGMFIEEGAIGENYGKIKTIGSGNKGQIGVAVMKGSKFINHLGAEIDVVADNGYGLFYVNGATIENYGDINIIKKIEASDPTKVLGTGKDSLRLAGSSGAPEITITAGGVVQKPKVVDVQVQAIANRAPNDIPISSVGMYINTSGINYTKPITNLGVLPGLTEADLIVGTEATNYTNAKYIQLSQKMIEPYNEVIRNSGIEKWSIYAGSLTWMATITQQPDFTIRNAYLAKVPYTVFANDKNTTRDTYNFTDGLEQRYGVEGLNSREKQVFEKLNSIG